MKTKMSVMLMAVIIFISVLNAQAEIWEWTAQTGGFNSIDHSLAYAWKLALPEYVQSALINGETITATLSFDNIENWDDNANYLHLNLLANVRNVISDSVKSYSDNYGDSNFFTTFPYSSYYFSSVTWLGTYGLNTTPSLNTTPKDISYTFDSAELSDLRSYVSSTDNIIGIGLDPDCHYYMDGVKLVISNRPPTSGGINAVPEPGSVLLLGIGILSIAGWQRRIQS